MKDFQMRQLKQSWSDAANRKKNEKEQPPTLDIDASIAGPASLQKMSGEDVGREERIRTQKEKMKTWIQDQIAEKQYIKQLDREDDLNYGEMVKAIDEIREATEKEEKEMRRYVTDHVKAENHEVKK